MPSLGIEDLVEGLRAAALAAQTGIDEREVALARSLLGELRPELAGAIPLKSSRIVELSVDLPVAVEEMVIPTRPKRKVLALRIGRPTSARAPQLTLRVSFTGDGLARIQTQVNGVAVDFLAGGAA